MEELRINFKKVKWLSESSAERKRATSLSSKIKLEKKKCKSKMALE
jgi:hypothetical protein